MSVAKRIKIARLIIKIKTQKDYATLIGLEVYEKKLRPKEDIE